MRPRARHAGHIGCTAVRLETKTVHSVPGLGLMAFGLGEQFLKTRTRAESDTMTGEPTSDRSGCKELGMFTGPALLAGGFPAL